MEDYTGHGVGRNLHEEPSVFNFRTDELPNVTLRPGMTLAIEPILNAGSKACRTLKDRWTVVTRDGSLSVNGNTPSWSPVTDVKFYGSRRLRARL